MSSSFFITFVRIVLLGARNYWRNRLLTLGATLLMTLTLTMISVSIITSYIIRETADSIRDRIDLMIYFRDDAVVDQKIIDLGDKIKNLDGVETVDFIDKREALAIFQRMAIDEQIRAFPTEENNPFPRSLQIETDDPDRLEGLVAEIVAIDREALVCSTCVSYTQNRVAIDKIRSITSTVQYAGIALALFFGLIAVFNVMNIIRITIISRSDEIEIMRFVGASNAFVRGPFIVEGIFYGLAATVFTSTFLYLTSKILSWQLAQGGAAATVVNIFGLDISQMVIDRLPILILIQLGIGLILGVIVSLVSMRRYLKA